MFEQGHTTHNMSAGHRDTQYLSRARAPYCYQSTTASSPSNQHQETMQGRNASTSKSTMAFKQELLKNLLLSLRARTDACRFSAMSLQERKRAVKASADVAMAAARGAGARWPKAILAAAGNSSCSKVRSRRCSRRVVRRCLEKRRGGLASALAGSAAASSVDVARRLVRRRTMALRKVIPGGDAAMDDASLLREAMDYVVHLRAQVDVLRRVSEAVQRSGVLRDSNWSQSALKGKEAPSSMRR